MANPNRNRPQPPADKPDEDQPADKQPLEQLAAPEIPDDAPLETFDEDEDGEELPELPEVATPSEEARGRQGDQTRPTCPQCSTPDKPVLLTASSTRSLFTWYGCECGFRTKVPRPNINEIMQRRRSREGEDFSAR